MKKPIDSYKAWDESCFSCAVKRGYSKEYLLSMPYPFNCVHRTDLEGRQHACAVWKDKLKVFKGEGHV